MHIREGEFPMTHLYSYAMPVGRVLIALIFIMAGFGKFADPGSSAGYMAAFGVPTLLLWPAAIFELVAGIFILIGFQPASRLCCWQASASYPR